jgi:hypothetical protein
MKSTNENVNDFLINETNQSLLGLEADLSSEFKDKLSSYDLYLSSLPPQQSDPSTSPKKDTMPISTRILSLSKHRLSFFTLHGFMFLFL